MSMKRCLGAPVVLNSQGVHSQRRQQQQETFHIPFSSTAGYCIPYFQATDK